jgi:hypothetical protein
MPEWPFPPSESVADITIRVVRYGALGIEEITEQREQLTQEEAAVLLAKHVVTLGPADRAEIVLARPWPERDG